MGNEVGCFGSDPTRVREILFDSIREILGPLNKGDGTHVHSRGAGRNGHEEPHNQSEVVVLRRCVRWAMLHSSF